MKYNDYQLCITDFKSSDFHVKQSLILYFPYAQLISVTIYVLYQSSLRILFCRALRYHHPFYSSKPEDSPLSLTPFSLLLLNCLLNAISFIFNYILFSTIPFFLIALIALSKVLASIISPIIHPA